MHAVSSTLDKIAIIGDSLRPDLEGGFGDVNRQTLWLHRMLRRPIEIATSLALDVVTQGDNQGQMNAESLYAEFDFECRLQGWASLSSKPEFRERLLDFFRPHIKPNTLYIGFELPEVIRALITELGGEFIDVWIHPIRFLDDLLFAISASHPAIRQNLCDYLIDEQQIWLTAGLREATLGRWRDADLPSNTLLVAGQTKFDKSQIEKEPGAFFDANRHLKKIEATLENFKSVLTLAHPYGREHSLIDAVHELRPDSRSVEGNLYYLLAQKSVTTVLTVNSSCAEEARYFQTEAARLLPPPVEVGYRDVERQRSEIVNGERYASLDERVLLPDFWRHLLAPMMAVTDCDNRSFTPKANRIRIALQAYWGFRGFDQDALHAPLDPELSMNGPPLQPEQSADLLPFLRRSSETEKNSDGSLTIRGGEASIALYGPYWRLPAGQFELEYEVQASTNTTRRQKIASLELGYAGGKHILDTFHLMTAPNRTSLKGSARFEIPPGTSDFECRIWTRGPDFRLESLRLTCLSLESPTLDARAESGAHQAAEKDFSLLSGERQVATDLDGIRLDHRARYATAIRFLSKAFQPRTQHLDVLDVFCGNGYGAHMICSELGCTCLAIDGCEEAIQHGNQHYSMPGLFLTHKQFPFKLPLSRFDAVTCFESLEHVEDDDAFLANVVKSIKPNGYLFLSTPNESVLSLEKNPHPFHVRHYHPADVMRKANRLNLEVVSQYGQDVYQLDKNGVQGDLFPEREMGLRRNHVGQFQTYVFKRLAASEAASMHHARQHIAQLKINSASLIRSYLGKGGS